MELNQILTLLVLVVILAEVTTLLARSRRSGSTGKRRSILVDTSVLMDGRIISVAKTGFVGGTLVIPRSVIGELQLLADGSDSDKRARARYGLDVVAELQQLDSVDVEILHDSSRAAEGVDERLLALAKQRGAVICTLDFNLNKVAVVEGIIVLNINELAQSLRANYLPGDEVAIELVQKGQEAHQAVGYLPDGTMIVVEQASSSVGKLVEVEIIRSLQTAAGRMMFAKLKKSGQAKPQKTQPRAIRTQAANKSPEQQSKPSRQQSVVESKPANHNRPNNRGNQRKSGDHNRSSNSRHHPTNEESFVDLANRLSQ